LHGGQVEVRHHHGNAVPLGQFETDRARDAPGIDGARNDGAEHAGCDVIGMAFDACGLIENAQRFPVQPSN
jgi:hypothetical protein